VGASCGLFKIRPPYCHVSDDCVLSCLADADVNAADGGAGGGGRSCWMLIKVT